MLSCIHQKLGFNELISAVVRFFINCDFKNYENELQYTNLMQKIDELRKNTELIECLKVEGVKEVHFKEISEEVKVNINTDMKTMTLSDVMKLKLCEFDEFIR